MFLCEDFKVSEVRYRKLIFRFPHKDEILHTIVLVHNTIKSNIPSYPSDLYLHYEYFQRISPDVAQEISAAHKFDKKCIWFGVPKDLVKMIFSYVKSQKQKMIKHCPLFLQKSEPNEDRLIPDPPLGSEIITYTPFNIKNARSFSTKELDNFEKNYLVWILMDTKNIKIDSYQIKVMWKSNDNFSNE